MVHVQTTLYKEIPSVSAPKRVLQMGENLWTWKPVTAGEQKRFSTEEKQKTTIVHLGAHVVSCLFTSFGKNRMTPQSIRKPDGVCAPALSHRCDSCTLESPLLKKNAGLWVPVHLNLTFPVTVYQTDEHNKWLSAQLHYKCQTCLG